MYVLQLESHERDFLLSILKTNRTSTAKTIMAEIKSLEDVFGVVMWADEDVRSVLEKHGLQATEANIAAVRASYYARHIDEQMVGHGWEVLEEAVFNLKPE